MSVFPWILMVTGTASVLGLIAAVLGLVWNRKRLCQWGMRVAVSLWALLVLTLLVFAWASTIGATT